MATAFTDTVVNVSGLLRAKSNDDTRLLDAIYSRGRKYGEGIVRTGVRKVSSPEFTLASPYEIGGGAQPAITEAASVTAVEGTNVTRTQETNCIQIFQEAVSVSYLKQSAIGQLTGLNTAGQRSNVTNELDFQVAGKVAKMKKDLDYTLINGVYQKGTNNSTAWKSKGIIAGITTNAAEYPSGGVTQAAINAGLVKAYEKGFSFTQGMELWVNPNDLQKLNDAYQKTTGFALPETRTEGGAAINRILTTFGWVNIDYDRYIPEGTLLLLNMSDLAIAELDYVNDEGVNKGCWFYEALAKQGAAERGQIYGQAGVDYGAEWQHIKFTAGV